MKTYTHTHIHTHAHARARRDGRIDRRTDGIDRGVTWTEDLDEAFAISDDDADADERERANARETDDKDAEIISTPTRRAREEESARVTVHAEDVPMEEDEARDDEEARDVAATHPRPISAIAMERPVGKMRALDIEKMVPSAPVEAAASSPPMKKVKRFPPSPTPTPTSTRATKATSSSVVFKVPRSRVPAEKTIPSKISSQLSSKGTVQAAPTSGTASTLTAIPTIPTKTTASEEYVEALDAERPLSPLRDFDLTEDDYEGAFQDTIPSLQEDAEATAAEEIESDDELAARDAAARLTVRLDELKYEAEEMMFTSTELLLRTIQSTNDYFLLFNPKLMLELKGIKEEARRLLSVEGISAAPQA